MERNARLEEQTEFDRQRAELDAGQVVDGRRRPEARQCNNIFLFDLKGFTQERDYVGFSNICFFKKQQPKLFKKYWV